MDAYVIVIDEDVELGMMETAEKAGLENLEDVEIVDYAHHPLIEATRYEGDPDVNTTEPDSGSNSEEV